MSLVRVRQHVNPLSNRFKQPIAIPDWSQIFGDLNRPLAIDIGCARGRFVQQYAQLEPDWNFLGLEIRAPLVDAANEWREESGLNNVHFLFCNANVSLADLLQTYPASKLQRASIQFPDPWFKKRHQKRRVVQPALVETLAKYLPVGGEMFLQSDVCEVQEEMCDRFAEHPAFVRTSEDWLPENPMAVPTERELYTLENGEPVYRSLFVRQAIA
ncbi:MAG: tRNA (guanosine(46)-N7)-methyltransferase TrmB [Geitlerinemataceae cyanobacterium]